MRSHGAIIGNMAKNKKVRQDDKKQSQRFVETAKKLGFDESGNLFERTFKKLSTKLVSHRK